MKFFPEKGETFYVPLAERAKAKAYFMPERCLYCVDKLNACADISLGDNYTGRDESPLGSNSVIVRTESGMTAWNAVKEFLEIRPVGIADIQNAQALDWRLNQLYYGDNAVIDQGIAMEWARIPHFYYNYYVFQYATGYSAAIALSRKILSEGESAVKDYLNFLSGGCSKSPIDLLKGAGVDMTTSAPVEEALQLFGTLLDEMEKLMEE
jgi:hypothetical protein